MEQWEPVGEYGMVTGVGHFPVENCLLKYGVINSFSLAESVTKPVTIQYLQPFGYTAR